MPILSYRVDAKGLRPGRSCAVPALTSPFRQVIVAALTRTPSDWIRGNAIATRLRRVRLLCWQGARRHAPGAGARERIEGRPRTRTTEPRHGCAREARVMAVRGTGVFARPKAAAVCGPYVHSSCVADGAFVGGRMACCW
jgi:hypothetical protein